MTERRVLPPPPARPELSPPVVMQGEEKVRVPPLPGGPSLEAALRASPTARRAVLLCHPHPLYGGTMHSAVVVAIARALAERPADEVAWLRFNFRGVGASEGTYAEGNGEVDDARAALRVLRAKAPDAKVTVCGYSFGTSVGLRAARDEGGVDRVALVAPSPRFFPYTARDKAGLAGPIAIYIGDRDEFCSVEEAEELAALLGATLRVFPGNDHFFLPSRRKLAVAMMPFLLGAPSTWVRGEP